MSVQQELIQRVLDMQRNAQANLPVIPNNGNPRGINNTSPDSMLPPVQQQPTAPTPVNHYPWLKHSSSMDVIRQMLSQPLQPAMQPVSQTPATAPPVAAQLPVSQQPILPQRTSLLNNPWGGMR